MASLILINSTQAQGANQGPATYKAGNTITDSAVQAALIADGGLLWPATDTVVAAAAAVALKMYSKGYDEAYVSRTMLAAVSNSISSGIQHGFLTLASGTKTLATGITVTATSVVQVTRQTQGGTVTSTAEYEEIGGSRIVGGPGVGSITVQASVSAGTVNAADNSTLSYLIVG
jgi:hypothetical protein